MKPIQLLLAGAKELLSLLVDDVLTFVGALVGLTGTYLLAHHVSESWSGYVMYAVVWVFLAVSLIRAARR